MAKTSRNAESPDKETTSSPEESNQDTLVESTDEAGSTITASSESTSTEDPTSQTTQSESTTSEGGASDGADSTGKVATASVDADTEEAEAASAVARELNAESQAEQEFLQRSPKETPLEHLQPVASLADEPLWGSDPDPVIPYHWRPLFPLFIIAVCAWLMTVFWDDLQYYRVNKITNLGTVESGCAKDFYKKAKHNLFVNIDGILPQPNMTTAGRVKFEKRNYVVVLGCDLFVAVNAKWYKQFQKKGGGRFSAQGRLVQFLKVSSLGRLRQFYEQTGAFEFTKNTYLLYDKDEPRHHWWMIPVFLLLTGVIVYALWRFFVLVRRLLTPEEGEET